MPISEQFNRTGGALGGAFQPAALDELLDSDSDNESVILDYHGIRRQSSARSNGGVGMEMGMEMGVGVGIGQPAGGLLLRQISGGSTTAVGEHDPAFHRQASSRSMMHLAGSSASAQDRNAMNALLAQQVRIQELQR